MLHLTPAVTGDGILFRQSVGADLVGMGFSQMMPVPIQWQELFSQDFSSSSKLHHGKYEGKRFVDEYGNETSYLKRRLIMEACSI